MPIILSTNRLLGFLSFDVDVSRLDINQCDSDSSVSASQLQTFKETHKCHSETSQVRNWIIPKNKLKIPSTKYKYVVGWRELGTWKSFLLGSGTLM